MANMMNISDSPRIAAEDSDEGRSPKAITPGKVTLQQLIAVSQRLQAAPPTTDHKINSILQVT